MKRETIKSSMKLQVIDAAVHSCDMCKCRCANTHVRTALAHPSTSVIIRLPRVARPWLSSLFYVNGIDLYVSRCTCSHRYVLSHGLQRLLILRIILICDYCWYIYISLSPSRYLIWRRKPATRWNEDNDRKKSTFCLWSVWKLHWCWSYCIPRLWFRNEKNSPPNTTMIPCMIMIWNWKI